MTNQKSMDIAGNQGVFLGYTASQKNVYVKSTTTNKVHITLHKSFDEVHMTTFTETIPPMAQAMQKAGYTNSVASPTDKATQITNDSIKVHLLSKYAIEPTRSTELSAGLDIYSAEDHLLLPHSHLIIPTDIAIEPMQGTYAQLCTRSSTAMKGILVLGGVIDADYRGNIKVILQNNSDESFEIKCSQCISQMVVKKISLPTVAVVPNLQATAARGNKGFGSTEKSYCPPTPLAIDYHDSYPHSTSAAAATMKATDIGDIIFTDNPFDNEIDICIQNKGSHPTRGLDVTYCSKYEKVQLLVCEKGTPAGKADKWRSTLCNGFIVSVNTIPITNITQLKHVIRDYEGDLLTIVFSTVEKQALHPQSSVPQLYFDQLNHIGKHLIAMKYDPSWMSDEQHDSLVEIKQLKGILPKGKRRSAKLTRRKLLTQDNWNDWKESEFLQLEQYEKQKMFGQPQPLPQGANILPFLWTYLIKDDERKKAQCVCNGAPSKGTVTLGPTYAGSLDQTGN
jgi:dUTP pyrophosphatase